MPTTAKTFKSQRALSQYTGVNCRPSVCVGVKLITPRHETVSLEHYKIMNKTIDQMKETRLQELLFVSIDISTLRVVVLSETSFANASETGREMGFVVLLSDQKRNANIGHYGSKRSPHISRSVMEAEVRARVHA